MLAPEINAKNPNGGDDTIEEFVVTALAYMIPIQSL
jgi:hypothetical protein